MTERPEQSVLDAIAGLEQDEIGELVRWQLEEGRKRGDHLPESGFTIRIPSQEELDAFHARTEALRRAIADVPDDAPYRDHVKFEPGTRVGFQDIDGTTYFGVVAEHREDPEGSGQWTITLRDAPQDPAEVAAQHLRSVAALAGIPIDVINGDSSSSD